MHLDPSRLDADITDWVVQHRGSPWVGLAHGITVLGNALTLTVVAVVAFAVLLARRHTAEALLVGAGALVGSAVPVTLKHIFERQRPPVADRLLDIDTYSFPSGHALSSTVVYGLIAVAAYRLSPWVRAHPMMLVAAVLLPLTIGVTRVVLGVHWTTDVLAGWVIGALWVAMCSALCQHFSPMRRADPDRRLPSESWTSHRRNVPPT